MVSDAHRLAAWMRGGVEAWLRPTLSARAGCYLRWVQATPHPILEASDGKRIEDDRAEALRRSGWMCDGRRVWPSPELMSQALIEMCLRYGDF